MSIRNPNEHEKDKTIVYLIRHGDRKILKNDKGVGLIHPGPGLTALGKKQARELAKKLIKRKDEIDILYCSSMTRAIETANEVTKLIKKKPIIVDELSEVGHVLWKGKYLDSEFLPNLLKFRRARKAFDNILEKHKGKVIVIIAHGNLIKGLVLKKLGLSLKQINYFSHDNCHITKVRFNGKKLDYIHYYNNKEPT